LKPTAALFAAVGALALTAPVATAAGPPIVGASWSSSVQSDSARLSAQINPNGLVTTYHFDYVTEAAFQVNGFTEAKKVPPVTDSNIGSAAGFQTVVQQLAGLSVDTAYRYRVVAKNSGGPAVTGPTHTFRTLALTGGTLLPDSRGWEMVSPVDKNGGLIDAPGAVAGGGVLQAATDGESVTYGSTTSFGEGGQGAPLASQYIGSRTAGGWTAANITAPIFSGSYDTADQGVPYQLFSPDLTSGLLLNGDHCRGEASGCGVANPPFAGTDAPGGYQNYYLRNNTSDSFEAVLGDADVARSSLKAANFDVRLAGASPDLQHVVLSTCAALTANATEVPLGGGCDPAMQNLYEWSSAAGLSLVNILPAQSTGNPGSTLGAQSAAVSTTGTRVYWSDDATGNLYLREGGQTKLVDAGTFETASGDGAFAFYTKAGHLYRYSVAGPSNTDLTPAGGVTGVIGASNAGDYVYYVTAAGISVWHTGTTTAVAPAPDSSNYPPSTGTARVSADGTHLLFLSNASLTGYDNVDLNTGNPDSEVFLYDANGATSLSCVSCNPTNERPIGASTIPGAVPNGTAAGSTEVYKPRNLAADGSRVYFDTHDALASTDTNFGATDVYQWEAQGKGNCTRPEGCVALISSGRSTEGASFVDASTDGANVFFLTDASLVAIDPGSIDLYDARVGGGFPVPAPPIPCEGDACQPLPEQPVDPTLTTLTPGHGNPPPKYHNLNKKKRHHKKHHKRKHHRRQGR
jgi:hypothetical protein